MNKQDRYKLSEEEKDILYRAARSWQEELDRMPATLDPQYAWRKVSKVKKVKK